VKVGDLVSVGMDSAIKIEKPFISIIMDTCMPKEHHNKMHLIQVLENGQAKWYPVGCIEVIGENR